MKRFPSSRYASKVLFHNAPRTADRRYLLARGSNYSVTSIGATWAARCDDSLGAAVPIEVSPVRVLPKPGKCVGLAGFQVNASLSRRYTPIDLWSRAYRQDMLPGATPHRNSDQAPNPQPDTVDKQDEAWKHQNWLPWSQPNERHPRNGPRQSSIWPLSPEWVCLQQGCMPWQP
ncbi:MAG: hypothetical protein Udaeo2_12040 [Candidatus Udaeobacter sp.]|nr:MAG: hypothetical protein Udaeo2_12040 [Candidatus Udaeobacter sp.]